jgi:hypothetical protein
MPSIAAGSEAWMALSIAMDSAMRAQARSTTGTALTVRVEATGVDGIRQMFEATLPQLELVTVSTYESMVGDELALRRFGEIEAADIQTAARTAVQQRDWERVEAMLHDIESRAHDNPWLMNTLVVLRTLLAKRDHEKLEKELMYSSYSMKSRLSELDEFNYRNATEEMEKMAFLRRKTDQGRRTQT